MKHPNRTHTPAARRHLTAMLSLPLALALALGLTALPTAATASTDAAAPLPAAAAEAGLSAGDWQAIRAGMDDHRHQVRADGEHLVADNPGQRWQLRFDQQGFLVRPAAGRWQWGLGLSGWGRGQAAPLPERGQPGADGNRVDFRHDERLTEWAINDRRGLEHGFTVAAPPSPGEAPLVLHLAVRGTLQPQDSADGRGIGFTAADGTHVLDYSGLVVADADGRALPARLAVVDDGVRFVVDDAGARYPIIIDPVATEVMQEAYLKASNTGADDRFGSAVAVSGDTAVVGAQYEDSSTLDAGAAYVFVRDPDSGIWSQDAFLKASNPGRSDWFGTSIAISGDTVVVGASGEESNGVGVDSNQGNNSASDAGAAYVFVRDADSGIWSQQAYLKASNTGAGDYFGSHVAVCEDTVVVGAVFESSSAVGVDGDGNNNDVFRSGAAYVFIRDPDSGIWSQQAYLKASNTDAGDRFGSAVAVSGDTAVVGASYEGSSAAGVDGDETDNSVGAAGAAYVFVRDTDTGSWSQQAYLKASNTGAGDWFGRGAVAISGDTVVVGAWAEDSSAVGVNGDGTDNSARSAGAAYVFVRDPASGTWSQQAYLKASNTGANDLFGNAVGVSGDIAVVGASYEGSSAAGVDGDETDNSVGDAGAAYVFVRDPASGTWSQQAYLKASNTGAVDTFGGAVAVSGEIAVVAASGEDSSAVGIDGAQANNSARNAGAAYVFSGLDLLEPATEVVYTATNPRQTLSAHTTLPTRFAYTARAQAGGRIQGFVPGTDQVDLTAVLTEQGWTGTDPIADGTLRLLDRRGRCYLLVDPDGSTGSQRAFTLTVLDGVPCTELEPATDFVIPDVPVNPNPDPRF